MQVVHYLKYQSHVINIKWCIAHCLLADQKYFYQRLCIIVYKYQLNKPYKTMDINNIAEYIAICVRVHSA